MIAEPMPPPEGGPGRGSPALGGEAAILSRAAASARFWIAASSARAEPSDTPGARRAMTWRMDIRCRFRSTGS